MAWGSVDAEQEGPSPRRWCDRMAENEGVKKRAACDLEGATDSGPQRAFSRRCLEALNEAHCAAGLFHLFTVRR